MLLRDLILDRPNEWSKLYDPSRKTLRAVPNYARENLNVAAHYGDWFTSGDIDSENDLQAGQGGVVRHGLKKVAAYRDETGQLHELSAVCPHLGCIVSWNGVDKTWDCPCHGSRFDCLGKVVQGPANSDLTKVQEEVPARAH
jgi:Rieske Fe-S protein